MNKSKREDGRNDSWESWLRLNASRLLLFARQQSRSEEDAEDIVQDALVRLAQKEAAGEFQGGQEAWLSYVYASIRRLAVDYGRKQDRRHRREEESTLLEEDSTSADVWLSSDAADEEMREQVESLLKKLPPKFSEVIVLKVWGEKTFQEIAEILDISLNTVASRYRYGIEKLRKAIVFRQDDF